MNKEFQTAMSDRTATGLYNTLATILLHHEEMCRHKKRMEFCEEQLDGAKLEAQEKIRSLNLQNSCLVAFWNGNLTVLPDGRVLIEQEAE